MEKTQTEILDKYVGPLTAVFGNPIAKLLDQTLIVGNMEQTISMLAESTDLAYKTVASAVEKLVNMGYMTATRKIGNAQAYKFKVENHLSEFIRCAQKMRLANLANEIE